MNKPILRWTSEGEWRSAQFKLAQRVYIEISTRNIYRRGDPINFAEFLNVCFPMIEGLRDALRLNDCPVVATSSFASRVNTLITDLLRFEDKWNFTYSQWLNAFKGKNPEVKKLLMNGESYAYEDVQSFMRSGEKLYDDISEVIVSLESMTAFAADIMQQNSAEAKDDRLSKSHNHEDKPATNWWLRIFGKK
jgi:hypothetical protein